MYQVFYWCPREGRFIGRGVYDDPRYAMALCQQVTAQRGVPGFVASGGQVIFKVGY